MRASRSIALLGLLLSADLARAQSEEASRPAAGPVPALTVRLETGKSAAGFDPIEFTLSVQNRSDTRVSITEVRIGCPAPLRFGVRPEGITPRGGVTFPFDVPPNSPRDFSLTLDEIPWSSLYEGTGWLSARSDTYTFKAEVVYTPESAQTHAPAERLYAHTSVPLEVPITVLLVGALGGALLVGLLVKVAELSVLYHEKNLNWKSLGYHSISLLLRLLVAMMTAALVIILARATTDWTTIVSIKLIDFGGGFTVGALVIFRGGPIAKFLRHYGVRFAAEPEPAASPAEVKERCAP